MKRCVEFIAYEIKADSLEDFERIKGRVAAEAHELDGLLSSTTLSDASNPLAFVDVMVWEDAGASERSREAFAKLPTTPEFMSMFAGPPTLEARYEAVAGDMALALVGGLS